MAYALADILYSAAYNGGVAEQIAAAAAPSLNNGFRQIYKESGIKPKVLRVYGGARTAQQCWDKNLSPAVSDHWEGAWDERGRAAVDIDNQRDIRNKIGSARFEKILRDNGWENVTVDGAPFPLEPWHFATRKSWLAALDIQYLIEGADTMTATVPVKYTNSAGKSEWARYRSSAAGGVIDKSSDTGVVSRWKNEIDYTGDAITTNAKLYLTDWAGRILVDTAALKAIVGAEVAKIDLTDEAALGAAIAAELDAQGIVDFPTVQEISEGVADEQAQRQAE